MDEEYKEVYFNEWCPKCEHENLNESDDICDECLSEPTNLNSHKPVNWKEKEK